MGVGGRGSAQKNQMDVKRKTWRVWGEKKNLSCQGKPKLCLQAILWVGKFSSPVRWSWCLGAFRWRECHVHASVWGDTLLSFWPNFLQIKKSGWWSERYLGQALWNHELGRGNPQSRGVRQRLLTHWSWNGCRERPKEKAEKGRWVRRVAFKWIWRRSRDSATSP